MRRLICERIHKIFLLQCFSDKQLPVSSFVVIEGRLTKDMLSKNKG